MYGVRVVSASASKLRSLTLGSKVEGSVIWVDNVEGSLLWVDNVEGSLLWVDKVEEKAVHATHGVPAEDGR